MNFKGKKILVTGGSYGLGKSICVKLADLGAQVFAIARTQDKLEALKKERPSITIRSVDISNWELTRNIIKEFLPLDMVVNNAAICVAGNALDLTEDAYDSMMNVNVKAAVNIMQVVGQDLITRKRPGSIVNISSTDAKRPFMGQSGYAATKAAIDMLTRSFALELGPNGIRVNAVNPGLLDTPMGQVYAEDKEVVEYLISQTPMKKVFTQLEDVVNAVVFLLSEKSAMITGHCLPVDGGFCSM